jgi:thiol-disulfide isomerase/thioredoxin
MNNDLYYKKYLTYKTKYYNLKYNMLGGGNKINVILFKAEWCGHCNKFKPIWKSISESYASKYNFIVYDSDKDTDIFNKYKVNAFPTIIIEDNDVKREYEGDRTEKELSNFLTNLKPL